MGFFSHTWIGCLLAFLPGPPRVKFNNAQFQLFPVDKTNKYCPEVQPERDVGFYLFSKKFPEEPQILRIGDDVALASSYLDFRLPIVIYFPPFFDGIDSGNVREIKQAYLKKGGYNFLVVGSARLNAGPWYPTAVTNTFIVGKYTAAFIDYLLLKGISVKNLHLVGFSIGAHAAGVAGRYMKLGKPPRITGLDPASLLFTKKHRDMRLDKSDADLVDVIHTDRKFGMFYPIGHVDFFVNPDIYPQPGCKIQDIFTPFKGILQAATCALTRFSPIPLLNRPLFQEGNVYLGDIFNWGFVGLNLVNIWGLVCRQRLGEFILYGLLFLLKIPEIKSHLRNLKIGSWSIGNYIGGNLIGTRKRSLLILHCNE